MSDQLKSMLNNLINDKHTEAGLDLHNYITTRVKATLEGATDAEGFNEKAFKKVMHSMEDHLEHECRYKEWDYDKDKKEVEWVTQESDDHESEEAAHTIADVLGKAGFHGWKVKVMVRDKRGSDDWETATSK